MTPAAGITRYQQEARASAEWEDEQTERRRIIARILRGQGWMKSGNHGIRVDRPQVGER